MKINVMRVGVYAENCYILGDENALIIDPGAQPNDILNYCKNNGITIKAILLTHGHFDHVGGVTVIKKATGADVMIHKDDNELLINPDLVHYGISAEMNKECGYEKAGADRLLSHGEIIKIFDMTIEVIHTKGHTKGSCCFLISDSSDSSDNSGEKFLFSGDTLFEGSVGRTDLYGGNSADLMDSIRLLADLKIEATVLPGHGDTTTLKIERVKNPFMGQNYDDIF